VHRTRATEYTPDVGRPARKRPTQNLTIRAPTGRRATWSGQARAAGMSLNKYICYVLDHVRVVVATRIQGTGDVRPRGRA